MCGICGIVDFAGPPIGREGLQQMTDSIRHRGPDDSGLFLSGPVALGHRRLSIIDLSEAGHQPMHTDDGQVTIVYNGELYNFPQIRDQLAAEGVSFRSRSDTEVILKAFIRRGHSLLPQLNGMFAFALWDAVSETLHLVRDRFGIKPLYYYQFNSGLVFGSEIKALLVSGRIEPRMNWQALHEYLFYVHAIGTNTMFEGVQELLPGHHLTFSRAGCQIEPYWEVDEIEPVHDGLDLATESVRSRLETAVKDHLIADVPVGVFLSGGIDSSAITALAARHYGGRLKTYSVGFDFGAEAEELPQAKKLADQLGTEHHELFIEGAKLPETIEALVASHDEPFADAANIPLYLLCQMIAGSIKVILQGDGGDEIFAGYRRYNVMKYEAFWQTVGRIAPLMAPLIPKRPAVYRALRFCHAMADPDPAMRMALLLTQEDYRDPPTRVLSHEAAAHLNGHGPFQRYHQMYDRLRHLDPVQRMLYTDCRIVLPDKFLEKVDKPTMRHSIEVRVPMLDANLTSYVMGLPASLKVRGIQKKWILRRALRGIVPDETLDRKKAGFGVPYKRWLRGPLADYMKSVLLDTATLSSGLFDEPTLRSSIDEHVAGRRDNGYLLYKLLNLALWRRMYLA